jgi:Trypsin-like peptidase domain
VNHPLGWSLVKIVGETGIVQGGGFLVSPNTICTCFHVVFGEDYAPADAKIANTTVRYQFVNVPGWTGNARPRRWSKPVEFSGDILYLDAEGARPEQVRVSRLYDLAPSPHSPVEIYGFPASVPTGVWADGFVGQPVESGWRSFTSREQFGTPLQRGFSGSPVWDVIRQAMIGMVVGVIKDPTQRVGFIIPNQLLCSVDPNVTLDDPSTEYFGRRRAQHFIDAARVNDHSRSVIDYLGDLAPRIQDPTQRYWVYVAVADIGGSRAAATLRRLRTHENNLFAAKAIEDGLRSLT